MNREQLESELAETLENGEMRTDEIGTEAIRKLPHPTEVRIQAEIDPIAEETRQYRRMAREVDERYACYDDEA